MLSIVIPTAAHEPELQTLLEDLKGTGCEIIISAEGTRAKSLNNGAAKAQGTFLWFLHADSRITTENIYTLLETLTKRSNSLYYFNISFHEGGIYALNAWGANMRSRLFGLPFGDQGLCISKTLFDALGGYPEDVPFGEDLIFVWRARQAGIKLNRIASTLSTSARKYKDKGWVNITVLYQWRWICMSIPEAVKMLKAKK